MFPDDNANIFPALLSTSYGSFSPLIWSSIAATIYYIIFEILFLKLKGLTDVRVGSTKKKNVVWQCIFCKDL